MEFVALKTQDRITNQIQVTEIRTTSTVGPNMTHLLTNNRNLDRIRRSQNARQYKNLIQVTEIRATSTVGYNSPEIGEGKDVIDDGHDIGGIQKIHNESQSQSQSR